MTQKAFILRLACPLLLALLLAAPIRAQTPAKPQTDAAPRLYIGVAVEAIPALMAEQLQLQPDQGLNIQRIIPNSPAANADLQVGDLMIVVNDAPLTSQKQLNDNIRADQVNGQWQPKPVALEYLRKGVRHTVTLIPAPRPENLLASGPAANINSSAAPKTYTGADGVVHQVGTGYLIDTRNSNAINKSISSLTLNDQPVILSQESDAAGHVKTTVTIQGKTQEVDPAHLDALPPDLRNLVKPLLTPATAPAGQLEQMEDKLRQQDQQIKELQEQLKELLKSQPQK